MRNSGVRDLILAGGSGFALGCSGPPMHLGFLAYVSIAPLLVLVSRSPTYRRALLLSYLFHVFLVLIVAHWLFLGAHWYLRVSAALFVLCYPVLLSLVPLLWKLVSRTLGDTTAWIAFPFLWVAMEFLQAHTQLTVPFIVLAHSQTYDIASLQMASVVGGSGISFVIAGANVLVMVVIRTLLSGEFRTSSRRLVLPLAGIAAAVLLPRVYGATVLHDGPGRSPERRVTVSCVQPAIDPYEKWMGNAEGQIARLLSLTNRSACGGSDLAVWPETAIPLYILQPGNDSLFACIRIHMDSLGVPLLTGFSDWVDYPVGSAPPASSKFTPSGTHYDLFNAAMLLRPGDAEIPVYRKIVLMPFFEHVPYNEQLAFLDVNVLRWNFGTGGYRAGTDTTVFRIHCREGGEARFGTVICYETEFPWLVADVVKKGAEFMVVITNDSWWGNSAAPYQHKQLAVLRAVESRRWLVRCANGGISCCIDPYGRVVSATHFGQPGTISFHVPLRDDITPFVRHGDWVGRGSALGSLLIACIAVAVARRTKPLSPGRTTVP